jgi:hypothetical protein
MRGHRLTLGALGLVLLTGLVAAACSGRNLASEQGASQCSDSLDNDNDGKIDCADPDCLSVAFCWPRIDAGSADLAVPSDATSPFDLTSPADMLALDQQAGDSSYGRRCSYSGQIESCSDGETLCVRSKYSTSWGYCTYACEAQGTYCPPSQRNTFSYCGYHFDQEDLWYCIFLCDHHLCPSELSCIQGFCFPD